MLFGIDSLLQRRSCWWSVTATNRYWGEVQVTVAFSDGSNGRNWGLFASYYGDSVPLTKATTKCNEDVFWEKSQLISHPQDLLEVVPLSFRRRGSRRVTYRTSPLAIRKEAWVPGSRRIPSSVTNGVDPWSVSSNSQVQIVRRCLWEPEMDNNMSTSHRLPILTTTDILVQNQWLSKDSSAMKKRSSS